MANKEFDNVQMDVTFTEASSHDDNIVSGENIAISLGKLAKWKTDFHKIVWSGSYNDLSNKPTIPTVNNGKLTIQKNGTSVGEFTANQSGNTTANIIVPTTPSDIGAAPESHTHTFPDIKPIQSKTFTDIIATANNIDNATFYFGKLIPDSWIDSIHIRYRVKVYCPSNANYYQYADVNYYGRAGTFTYMLENLIYNGSYRPAYYHCMYRLTNTGFTSGYGHLIGESIYGSTNPTSSSYKRTFEIDILEVDGGTFEFFDNMTLYANAPGTGSTNYAGRSDFNFSSNGLFPDANTVTQLRYDTSVYVGSNGVKQYSLIYQNPDDKYDSLTTTNGTGTSKAWYTSAKIAYPPRIFYYGGGSNVSPNGLFGTSVTFAASALDMRYSDNITTSAGYTISKSLYLECDWNEGGGCFTISGRPYKQTFTAGKYYIFLGWVYTKVYQLSLQVDHPVYFYDGEKLIAFEEHRYALKEHNHEFADITTSAADIRTALNLSHTIISGSQTTTSSADGGSNVYTFTDSEGTTSTFTVKNGSKGSTGTAATISVGTVTTGAAGSSASVTNSGSSSAAKFDFTIPKGDTGAAAGFGTPTATVDANVGIPSVTVTASGSNTAKVFAFAFKNLKGEPGSDATVSYSQSITNASTTIGTITSGSNTYDIKYTPYSHPTSAGNKHIPSGGSSGQFLKYSASGTATWYTLTKSDIPALDYVSSTTTRSANTVLAGPSSGDAAAPTFRALVAADLPSHTHTKSQITDFPTSLKNPSSLTVQGNGTTSFTYDGSAAKTLNIKPGTGISVGSDTSGNITITNTSTNTDTKVTQNNSTANSALRVLLSKSANDTNETDVSYKSSKLTFNPSTGTLTATTFSGALSGNASTATKLATARTITLSGSVTGSASFDGSDDITISTTTNHTHSYLPLSGGTLSGDLNFSNSNGAITWNSSTYHQRIQTVDDSTANTNVFVFQQSSNSGTSWTDLMTVQDNGNVIATTFTGDLVGNADTATALTSSAGSATQPVYFSSGKPVACTYTLGKSVPSSAVFTDTKVTAVGNHYTPSGGTTTSASGGTLTDITNSTSGVQVVTGVTKDAAGHVTGITSIALKSVNTNTDTKVTSTTTNPTTATTYYPTWVTGATTGGVLINNGFTYGTLEGTTSADGYGIIKLGNSTASGTAGNKYGRIDLFSNSTSYGYIRQADTTSAVAHTLPATSGTLLNTGTTSFTRSLTSGTKIGTIKINGTSTDIYCQTNTDTKVTASTVNPTAVTNYYPTWVSDAGTSGVSINNGLRYSSLEGSTDSIGYGRLILGNNVASGTDGNKYGGLVMYGTGAYYTVFRSYEQTDQVAKYLVGASSAEAVGSSTKPVYISSTGTVTACTYTLGKSVPSDAVFTDTHYTSHLVTGASATATANAAATNGNVYLNILDNTTVRDSHNIVGSGATTVTSDANGKITISSTNTVYTHPTYTARTGKPTANATPAFGGTFTVSQITSDGTGHVTGATDRTITIPSTTMGAATADAAGTIGLVPAPAAGKQTSFLRGDGTWVVPTNTTYSLSGAASSATYVITLTPSSGTATTATVPAGTTSAYGLVKLSSATNSTSTALAATPSAVKSAYDLASGKSVVSFTQSLTSGTKVGTITIDGTATDIYCQMNTNTDTKVTQNNSTSNSSLRVLLSKSASDTNETDVSYKSSKLTMNPSTGVVSISTSAFGGLQIERDGTSYASVVFKNATNGTLGSIGMNTANGNLVKHNYTDGSPDTQVIVLDKANTSFTQSLTSGTKVGSINIGGTSTDIYAPTNTNTTYTLSGAYGSSSNTWVTTLTTTSGTASGTSTVPTASTSVYGITKLSSSTSSTSTALAATASAVKSAYDLASGKSTVSFAASLTSGTKVGTITINGTATDLYCQTNTDAKVTSTTTNPTTKTTYYPTWVTGATTGGVAINDGFRFDTLEGTADATGYGIIKLGNSTASGTAGNKYGRIDLFSNSTSYGYIRQADTTAAVAHTLPATSGTILNTGTTSFTASLTSGTKIGTIKINGTSTDLYCQTNTDTKVTQSVSTTSSYRPLLMGYTNSTDSSALTTSVTNQAYVADGIYCKPSEGAIYSNTITTYHEIINKGRGCPSTTGGAKGYYCIAQFTVTGTYFDAPIEVEVSDRGKGGITTFAIRFSNVNSTDPGVGTFRYRGIALTAYICKSDTSTWQLWVLASANYSEITIHSIKSTHLKKFTVSYPESYLSSDDFATAIADGGSLATYTKASVGTEYQVSAANQWITTRYINGMGVNGTGNRVNYGTCSTAAGTAAKTVACTGYSLQTGGEITVKFTVTNTASSPTLNVNSTGAKAIYYKGAAIPAEYLEANRTCTFRYNGTQYELVGDAITSALSTTETAPVQNKVVTTALQNLSYLLYETSGTDTLISVSGIDTASYDYFTIFIYKLSNLTGVIAAKGTSNVCPIADGHYVAISCPSGTNATVSITQLDGNDVTAGTSSLYIQRIIGHKCVTV
jgi:hypothetical protein